MPTFVFCSQFGIHALEGKFNLLAPIEKADVSLQFISFEAVKRKLAFSTILINGKEQEFLKNINQTACKSFEIDWQAKWKLNSSIKFGAKELLKSVCAYKFNASIFRSYESLSARHCISSHPCLCFQEFTHM